MTDANSVSPTVAKSPKTGTATTLAEAAPATGALAFAQRLRAADHAAPPTPPQKAPSAPSALAEPAQEVTLEEPEAEEPEEAQKTVSENISESVSGNVFEPDKVPRHRKRRTLPEILHLSFRKHAPNDELVKRLRRDPGHADWPVFGTRLVACTFEKHGQAVADIINHAILHSTSVYEYAPLSPAEVKEWFAQRAKNSVPVIGLEDADGLLLGFASWGPYRHERAYKYTVEHSIYVRDGYRGHGFGRILMENLLAAARKRQVHVMMAAIDAGNVGSCALHDKMGFRLVGTLPQVGFKFGRWLDLALYQIILDGPPHPMDG
ncbi:GNAT family N-acetyltransferase [Formicincola oecophyllae]|uniref:GNAT family N-acetyltransferase n=1 Tax=Formicincola oecophyllae TaxID=2558361 RepID=A0A4Y6U9Q2_9PROT|nr:GNAT family N-acetyltransferase [Formicincola oecophyllae]QDH13288.1 GNAT family N-acetyltransferase [Formicincola oecophyllae]